MTPEQLEALDPDLRKLYDEVAPMMREKGIDPDEAGAWQRFAERLPPVVDQLNAHRANTVALYKRMGR
jgi:hypothetical protein